MKNVEDLIVESLVNVADLCFIKDGRCINNVTNPMKNNLVFPEYCNGTNKGTRRVSEQEARFLFVQAVEQDKQFLYSVEAPTKEKYRFSGDGAPKIDPDGQAGNIDACLYDSNRNRKHLIEFKALNPTPDSYSKDFLKLICDEDNDKLTNYFVQVIENSDKGTFKSIEDKYKGAIENAQEQAKIKNKNQSHLVIFLCDMGKRVITKYSDWDDGDGNWTNVVTIPIPPKN
ncbi:MAG: hypothetical protein MdMp024_0339 [Bacteroidales bacterium]